MIKAFKFGLLDPVSGFDQSAIDVLFLRNKLWNNLVALERKNREKYRQIILDSDSTLSAIQARLNEIEEKRADLVAKKKKIRAGVRSKKVDTSLIDIEVEALLKERGELRSSAKELREKAKTEVKPMLAELDKARYEEVKSLVKESGLWWGNSETVVASYDVARVKAMKENAELRFRPFDGTGKYAVRQSGGFSLEDVMGGTLSFARIERLPDDKFNHLSERSKKHRARHLLTLTIFTYQDETTGKKERHQVAWPLILHRDLPGGMIKLLHVQRKRVGNKFQWSCSITMDVQEEPKQLADHPSRCGCGIDIGFREMKDGLRVATLADSKGDIEKITLPQDWLDGMNHVERLQGELSDAANIAWADLKNSLDPHPDEMKECVSRLRKAGDKTPVRGMRYLLGRLRADPDAMPAALEILEKWDRRTFRPSREMHNLRDKLQNRRKHIYRTVAHKIANSYSLVRIEDMDLRKLSMVKLEDGGDNELHQAARNNRKRAALYELTLCINQACVKTGAHFEKMNAAYSTMTCSECGHVNPHVEDIYFTCENCGKLHDQDENAAKNFLSGEYFSQEKQKVA